MCDILKVKEYLNGGVMLIGIGMLVLAFVGEMTLVFIKVQKSS